MRDMEHLESELADIQKTLQSHAQMLAELHAQQKSFSAPYKSSGVHWKVMLIVAAVVLAVGSYGAYQYYLILQSIIDQYPQNL